MMDLVGSIWWMVVSLGILVSFHEYGHYWAARRCGVHVLRFSVGFGKPLWMRKNAIGTEFAVAAIPLGGYVKMLDEREFAVPAGQRQLAFNNKSVWQRIAITAAGPLANLLLCVALLWLVFMLGRQDYSATLGVSTGLAAEAGLEQGSRLEQVDGRVVNTWAEASMALTLAAMDRRDARLQLRLADGRGSERVLPLSRLPEGFDERRVTALAGLNWSFMAVPARVGQVVAGGAAEHILLPGDLIVAVDGQPVHDASQVPALINTLGQAGHPGLVEVQRGGDRLALEIHPQQQADEAGSPRWLLGVQFAPVQMPAFDASQRHGPLAALPAALRETAKLAGDTLGMMRRLLTGNASLQNISGPVTIARVANASASRGADWFLYFLALMSLSLCIINLLPIPILDGGHLLYYLIELVKGSPLSERSMAMGQSIGLAILAGLMGLAFYNDILGLF
ncbi:MAG: RIP metalloprotease RseP [Stenotrophomonas sp.]